MLNVLESRQILHKKQYPFMLGGFLCGLTAIGILIAHVAGVRPVYQMTILAAELLLYMLLNAVSCLIVPQLWAHAKKTILTYILNFLLIGSLLYLLLGKEVVAESSDFYPALGALVFCFFGSMILISIIRSVMNFLKNE